jgi:hypothetical protein
MPLPKISTLNNVYINGVLNKQWNANGGTFGLVNPVDFITSTYGANGYGQNYYGGVIPNSATPYVQATSVPSFFGASLYDASNSSFSAQITAAPNGSGSVQTSIVMKQDEHNYVEMYVGPDGKFGGYSSNGGIPAIPTQLFPAYNPIAHAYWRIRNDTFLFFFEASPDGATWTTLASINYSWDITSVTLMFFAGYSGKEDQGLRAFINHVNQNTVSTVLSAKVQNSSFIHGAVVVTNPNALSGTASGFSGRNSTFHAVSGIGQGGLTDFGVVQIGHDDPATARIISYIPVNISGGASVAWARSYNTMVPAAPYRDGSYWQPGKTAILNVGAQSVNDTFQQAMTSVQFEKTPGSFNRLNPNVAFYTDTCEFAAQKSLSGNGVGSQNVTRSKDIAYAGNFSGKMVFGGSPATDGSGHTAYWPYPTRKALTPIINNTLGQETVRGSVALNTTRAGTQWYPALAIYDANFNLLSQSTFLSASVPTLVTHPGGGNWQVASVLLPTGITAARWISVVPVVIVPGTTPETVYMSDHTIVGITPTISSYPSTYVDPQQYTISLKPDRLNYAANSGFPANIDGWNIASDGTSGSPDSLSLSWDSTIGFNSLGSLKAHLAAPSGTYTGTANARTGPASYLVSTTSSMFPIIQGLKVGHTYTFSAWIKQGVGCPDIQMHILDPNYTGLYNTSLSHIQNTDPSASQGGWHRMYATFTIPPDGGSDYRLWFTVQYTDIVALAPFDFWIDSILVEETSLVGTYFDGGFASPEYQYEMQGGPDNRSYYYKDYTNKLARINAIIPQYAPIASSYKLLTAQPPT